MKIKLENSLTLPCPVHAVFLKTDETGDYLRTEPVLWFEVIRVVRPDGTDDFYYRPMTLLAGLPARMDSWAGYLGWTTLPEPKKEDFEGAIQIVKEGGRNGCCRQTWYSSEGCPHYG